jgi:integrase/recombinase XerD
MTTTVTPGELRRDIEAFLRFKRALGFRYRRAEFTLGVFRDFVSQRWGERRRVPLEQALRAWLSRVDGRKAVTVGLEFGVIRQLCLYRRRQHPSSFVPDHGWAPVKESTFIPRIFSLEEVRQIVAVSGTPHGRRVRGPMLRTLILVLYCTGLRLGEAVRLQLPDVDLRRQTFLVRESKGRTRIVPFRDDLAREVRAYLQIRRQLVNDLCTADSQALFLCRDGTPLTVGGASDAIRNLLRQIGIKPSAGRIGPRPYEFRHAFAVHRLTAWALAHADIHARLPWLSAYMGHQNVLGTETYLAATPQLLQLASRRFEDHLRRARRPR